MTTIPHSDYAVIDVETTPIADGETPKTLFWGYADGDKYEKIETTKEFSRFLRAEKRKTLLHHANFDLIQALVDGVAIDVMRSHNGKLIRCKWEKHTTVNTFSCFPVALAGIFEQFGFVKTPLSQLDKRNYEDCVNGLSCFLRLDEIFENICGVSPLRRGTIASTAFAAAQNFVGRPMPTDLRFLSAYRGGRVELYNLGVFIAHKYDTASSYPRSVLEAPTIAELLRVDVTSDDWYCPLFDSRVTDCLLFPQGSFPSFVFRDVWEKYIEPNTKAKIKIRSKHKIDFSWLNDLKPFVKSLFDHKEASKGAEKMAFKFLLNSMYGRIGLRGDSERARVMTYRPDGDRTDIYPLGRGRYLVFDDVQRECKSNYPFAAYITDNARGRLYESFVKTNALYGDTDSVITETPDSRFPLTIGNQCGDWKYEGCEDFQGLNVKDYLWGKEEVRKGGTHHLQWTLKQFARFGTARDVTRERQTELRKRTVYLDGTTDPLIVS